MLGETEMGRWEEIGAGVGAKLDSGFRGRVRVPGLLGRDEDTPLATATESGFPEAAFNAGKTASHLMSERFTAAR